MPIDQEGPLSPLFIHLCWLRAEGEGQGGSWVNRDDIGCKSFDQWWTLSTLFLSLRSVELESPPEVEEEEGGVGDLGGIRS